MPAEPASVQITLVLVAILLPLAALVCVVLAASSRPAGSAPGSRTGDTLTKKLHRPDLNFPEDDSKEDYDRYR